MSERWTPASWRQKPARHIPSDYPDPAALAETETKMRALPPLVFAGEARQLKQRLCQDGHALLAQRTQRLQRTCVEALGERAPAPHAAPGHRHGCPCHPRLERL